MGQNKALVNVRDKRGILLGRKMRNERYQKARHSMAQLNSPGFIQFIFNGKSFIQYPILLLSSSQP